MFWKKNNPKYLVKFKQDRYQNWIIESLRIPAKSEEELIESVKRITEQIMLQLKEMNE